MNLLEALRSNLPFRRKGHHSYIQPEQLNWNYLGYFTIDQILAEDWEVEEKQITITESDFNKAVARTGNLYHQDQGYWADALKKELGL